ncbi:MAG: lysophospholipid acyltransferase family protein [Gammaproteobacteria bacterium]
MPTTNRSGDALSEKQSGGSLEFAAPRYWPVWIGLGLCWLLHMLPFRLQLYFGGLLGRGFYYIRAKYRRITRSNIDVCFPEWSEEQKTQCVHDHFKSIGMSLPEVAYAWWASEKRLHALDVVEGLEHLEAARAPGCGVILLAAHFTTLEIAGVLLGVFNGPIDAFYRPPRNKLLDKVMREGRSRASECLIPSNDFRAAIRSLREGRTIWYAFDQHLKQAKGSMMVSFFGKPSLTHPALRTLAKRTGAVVVPFHSVREVGRKLRYVLRLGPALTNFPSGDAEADLLRLNKIIEGMVRDAPAQYLWTRDQFKHKLAEHSGAEATSVSTSH